MSKSDELKKIKKLEAKAIKMFRNGEDGKKVNKLLEQVIQLENEYKKKHGRNPSPQYGELE